LLGPSQKKTENLKAPQYKCFYERIYCVPLWPTYRGEGENFGQIICDKIEVSREAREDKMYVYL